MLVVPNSSHYQLYSVVENSNSHTKAGPLESGSTRILHKRDSNEPLCGNKADPSNRWPPDNNTIVFETTLPETMDFRDFRHPASRRTIQGLFDWIDCRNMRISCGNGRGLHHDSPHDGHKRLVSSGFDPAPGSRDLALCRCNHGFGGCFELLVHGREPFLRRERRCPSGRSGGPFRNGHGKPGGTRIGKAVPKGFEKGSGGLHVVGGTNHSRQGFFVGPDQSTKDRYG